MLELQFILTANVYSKITFLYNSNIGVLYINIEISPMSTNGFHMNKKLNSYVVYITTMAIEQNSWSMSIRFEK